MNLKQLSGFIAGPGGFLLLVFFFLPWISVSCSGAKLIEASGMDLASGLDESNVQIDASTFGLDDSAFEDFEFEDGTTIEPPPGEFDVGTSADEPTFLDEADPKLYIIPLIGLVVMGMAAAGYLQDNLLNSMSGLGLYIVPALIGIVIMILKFIQIEGEMNDIEAEAAAQGDLGFSIVSLNYEFGWWITGLSLLAIFAAGAMLFLGQESSKQAAGDLFPPQAKPKPKPESLSADEMKARFAQAKAHIEAKRYEEARTILQSINHPTATQWLQKIDDLDPFKNPFAE